MNDRGGRWLLVSFWLPTRSKVQRTRARRFSNMLIDTGYDRIHPGFSVRYLPSRRRVAPEIARLRAEFPAQGTVHIVESTSAMIARSLLVQDDQRATPPTAPELLTVY